jgi:phosphoglycolate phosphatase-like HAD superfamily hydrolase
MNSPVVIFDIDGTLTIDHQADGGLFFNTIGDLLNVSEIDHDLSSYSEITDSGIVYDIFQNKIGRDPTADELIFLEKKYAECLDAEVGTSVHFAETEGARIFVEKLESLGVQVGIATGNWRKPAEIKLKALGLERLLAVSATSTEARARKDILRLAAEACPKSGYCAKWYIGDGLWDLNSARALNFNFIGIGTRIKNFNPPYWSESFRDPDTLVKMIAKQ